MIHCANRAKERARVGFRSPMMLLVLPCYTRAAAAFRQANCGDFAERNCSAACSYVAQDKACTEQCLLVCWDAVKRLRLPQSRRLRRVACRRNHPSVAPAVRIVGPFASSQSRADFRDQLFRSERCDARVQPWRAARRWLFFAHCCCLGICKGGQACVNSVMHALMQASPAS